MNARAWTVTLAAASLMGLAVGGRTAFGLFVSPLNTASGLGLASLSLALALGQLAIGVSQPVVGVLADRFGAARVVVAGGVLLAAFTVMPALAPLPSIVAISVLASAVAGSAVGSNGLLLGEVNRAVARERAGFAVAIVGAGASVGQLVLGPGVQYVIERHGWSIALAAFAALSLVALPLAWPLRRLREPRRKRPLLPFGHALRDRAFWRVAASFGVCGFHVGFLGAHMPGVIERCGLPTSLAGSWIAIAGAANIAGSLIAGIALRRFDTARLLACVYLLRATAIALLLAVPPTATTMLAFAVAMGATHMATLPPTSQLVAMRHGASRLGTLFGVVMVVHQAGSFVGVALGGWAAEITGSDRALWTVDIALAVVAALLVTGVATARARRPALAT